MSREAFTIAYDGTALREGAMDVRDLAPALMALGQLFDAANRSLNGDAAVIRLQVKATEIGSFQIALELVQSWTSQILQFFETPEVSGATNLLAWVLAGTPVAGRSLLWLVKVLKGRQPDSVEKLPGNMMRLKIGTESYDVPLELLRLYQDVATRNALQKLVEEPLSKPGITSFAVKKDARTVASVSQEEAIYFAKPRLPDEILVEEVRRSAFSIISLTFKEENKWRLYDGNTQISAAIEDDDFLQRVETNQLSFSKGDILICDVRVVQRRTLEGLKTDYVVERVVEHIPGARQLPLPLTKSHHAEP
jgi:hypothetical protein